ncbi:MAG: hypothetical protein NPIRA03_00260 [Nitrospirales bacterium]|nr:MAG: hypothetical protein NPIRA03_00260 [Nitrospirales bacterium]
MQRLKIGPTFVLIMGGVAVGFIACGLGMIYLHEFSRMQMILEEQGRLIQAQLEVTKVYIAKSYVGKYKQSSRDSNLPVAPDDEPEHDAIPLHATAIQEVGKELGVVGVYQIRLVSGKPENQANAPKNLFEQRALELIKNGREVLAQGKMLVCFGQLP